MIKTKAPSEYEIHAAEVLAKYKIEFRAAFIFHGPYWPDDKESRNVWELILARGEWKEKKTVSFRFGQSIADSTFRRFNDKVSPLEPTQRNKPTSYDLLACLTKNDPGTFGDFCGDFGYDTDSRRAEKTYFAVQEEWEKVRAFFKPEEMEEIREIA